MNADTIVTKALGFSILLIVLIGFIGGVGGIFGGPINVDSALNIADGADRFAHENVTALQTQQTLGTELQFAGDGAFEGDINAELSGDWAVCTWVQPDDTDANMTVVAVSGEQQIQYHGNRSTPQWVGMYYDPAERESYDVSVTAADTANRTHLCFEQSGGAITLRANGTASSTVNTTGDYTLTDGRYNISDLNGSVDETRVYNTSLDTSQRTALRDQPSRPLDGVTPVARVMYDARSGPVSALPLYFSGTTGTVTNAQLQPGVGGDTLQEGTDYTLSNPALGRPVLSVVDGGDLDGAPVVFVSYGSEDNGFTGTFDAMWTSLTQVPQFVALGFVLLGGIVAMRLMEDF